MTIVRISAYWFVFHGTLYRNVEEAIHAAFKFDSTGKVTVYFSPDESVKAYWLHQIEKEATKYR